MKKVIVLLMLAGLLPAYPVFAQDDGFGGKRGRHNDGGFGGSNLSGGDKGDNSKWKGEGPKENSPKSKTPQNKLQRQLTPGVGRDGRIKNSPNWQGSKSLNRPNRNLKQPNQGLNGNYKGNNRQNQNRNQSTFIQDKGEKHSNPSTFIKDNPEDNGRHLGWDKSKNQSRPMNKADRVQLPAKFQKWGIKSFPSPIRDHSKILIADKSHSVIAMPKMGPSNQHLNARVFAPKAMSGRIVQNHMTTITNSTAFAAQVNVNIANETRVNNYYWHTWNGVNYCHYYDNWGYHWYGWYIGSSCFWTRWYCNNWWWYDDSYGRWCYWHDGGWWWQDPYHVNIVYVYNNGNYSSVNSAPSYNDNNGSQTVYQSNDGARKVKVMGDGQDAFLYDTSNNPSFDPVYLGSGVRDVKFSNTSNGSALQIMLTLGDGTFELFDGSGNPYRGDGN